MMNLRHTLSFVICLLFTLESNGCNFQTRNVDYRSNYSLVSDPVSLQVNMRRINRIGQNDDGRGFLCYLYSYGFDEGNAGSYNRFMTNNRGDRLYYNIYNSNGFQNVLRDIDDISQNGEAILGYALSRNTWYSDSFDFRLIIDNSVLVPTGNYTDTVAIKLYSGFPFNFPALERTRNLNLRITVDPLVYVSIVSVGAPHDPGQTSYTMNFGELETGERLAADLKVVSNTPYKVFFESQNGGVLKNTNPSSASEVNYQLFLNSSLVTFPGPSTRVEIIDSSSVTPPGGETYTLEAEIGNVTGKEAGSYVESITITAEAN